MDIYYKQEVSVGLLVLAAMVVLGFGVAWLSGSSLLGRSGAVTVQVQFTDVTGLANGDPVNASGVRVGKVTGIRLEGVDSVLVAIEIAGAMQPRADASAEIQSTDFLGTKVVSYTPGVAEQLLPDGAFIRGTVEAGILDGAADLGALTDQATEALGRINRLLAGEFPPQMNRMFDASERALVSLQRLLDGPLRTEATAAISDVSRMTRRLDSLLGNPALQQAVDNLDDVTLALKEMSEGLSGMSTSLASVMTKVDQGQGTIGRMVNDSTLYYDFHEMSQAVTALLNDMRLRPGRYFRLEVF